MTLNSESIIQQVRAEFEMLLDFVTGAEAQIATADRIERGLFKRLLELGARLLLLFFVVRAQNCSREPLQKEDGQELPYHDGNYPARLRCADHAPALWGTSTLSLCAGVGAREREPGITTADYDPPRASG